MRGATFAGLLADNLGSGGSLALTKTGSGVQTVSGANTYSGNTAVSAGTLQVGNPAAIPSGAGKGKRLGGRDAGLEWHRREHQRLVGRGHGR